MKKYELIQSFSRANLTRRINEHLEDGWELYEEPFTESYGYYTLYMQNMVIELPEEHEVKETLHRLYTNSNTQLGRMQLSLARRKI